MCFADAAATSLIATWNCLLIWAELGLTLENLAWFLAVQMNQIATIEATFHTSVTCGSLDVQIGIRFDAEFS